MIVGNLPVSAAEAASAKQEMAMASFRRMDGTFFLSLNLAADREIDPNRLFRFPAFNNRLLRRNPQSQNKPSNVLLTGGPKAYVGVDFESSKVGIRANGDIRTRR